MDTIIVMQYLLNFRACAAYPVTAGMPSRLPAGSALSWLMHDLGTKCNTIVKRLGGEGYANPSTVPLGTYLDCIAALIEAGGSHTPTDTPLGPSHWDPPRGGISMEMLAPEVRELLGKLAAISPLQDSVGKLSVRMDAVPSAAEFSRVVSSSLKAEYLRVVSLMNSMIGKESRQRDSDLSRLRGIFSSGFDDLDGRVRRLERPSLWRRICSKVRRSVRSRPSQATVNGEALARV